MRVRYNLYLWNDRSLENLCVQHLIMFKHLKMAQNIRFWAPTNMIGPPTALFVLRFTWLNLLTMPYSRPGLPPTVDRSDFSRFHLHVELASVRAGYCLTWGRSIHIRRVRVPRIGVGKVFPKDSEVQYTWIPPHPSPTRSLLPPTLPPPRISPHLGSKLFATTYPR